MKTIASSIALLALLAACSYKMPEEQAVKIISRHGFSRTDPGKLRELLRSGGLAGLRTLDKYAAVVTGERGIMISPAAPSPSYGMLAAARDGKCYLLRVFRGSPAEKAGLRDGDRLLSADSFEPGSGGFNKALSGLGDLDLRVERAAKSGASAVEVKLKAAPFSPPLIFGFYEPSTRTAFVRVGLFFGDSASIVGAGIAGLTKMGARNVILDLRGNRGGQPEEAAALLRLFARAPGPVLRLLSCHKGYTEVLEARAAGRFSGLPAAVLVDGSTSMTGEAFAAAMREVAGARVVGARTAGDVSVQRTFSLGDGRGLAITVARIAPPSGRDLEGSGLEPDIQAGSSGAAWDSPPAGELLDDAAYQKALELFKAGSAASAAPASRAVDASRASS